MYVRLNGRLLLGTLAVAVTVASAAACGSSDNPPPIGSGPGNSSSGGGGGVSGAVSLYTSEPDTDAAKLITGFNTKYPNVKVNVFRSGTEQVVSKIEAEKQAGGVQADVIFIADSLTMEKLKANDVLAQYASPEAKNIPQQYVTPYYTGTKLITTGIAINTTKVKADPNSWSDLAKPDAKGFALPSPLYSGAAAYNVAVMADDPQLGWAFWNSLAANSPKVEQGNGAVLKDVAGGQSSYGMVVDYLVARAAEAGSPVKFIYPQEGVPAITEPIAVSKSTKNQAAAQAFIDYTLSLAGQKTAEQLGYVPLNPAAPVPNGLKGVKDLKILQGDNSKLLGEIDAAKQKFQSTFK